MPDGNTYTPAAPLQAFVTNLGKYNEGALVGEWLAFPAEPEEVKALMERIGMDGVQYEEFFLTDFETDISGLYDQLGEYESLDELNYLATLVEEMSEGEREQFEAAIELGDNIGSLKDLINLTANLDCYDFLPDIDDDDDLGRYWVEESGCYDTKAMGSLASYIDHERFGRDVRLEEGGCFAANGYIRSTGDSFTEIYDGREVPEEYRVFRRTGEEREAEPEPLPQEVEAPEAAELEAEAAQTVQGYAVQKSVLFSDGRGVALAENPAAPQPFVTWRFTQEENGQRDYFWGQYFSQREPAQQDYAERALCYWKDTRVEVVEGELPKEIRFIDSQYTTLFTIPDGGYIAITHSDGERLLRPCRYVDECHTQVGMNVYHICEFAEKMEAAKNQYEAVPAMALAREKEAGPKAKTQPEPER